MCVTSHPVVPQESLSFTVTPGQYSTVSKPAAASLHRAGALRNCLFGGRQNYGGSNLVVGERALPEKRVCYFGAINLLLFFPAMQMKTQKTCGIL
jgi:hypothetical protein